ncbi:MAG: isoleucine--tRNA ligase [Candidatus Margulisbacteria bacterium]|jgi:isoleucyl-tRNA synthetase|nr:isoleucine--tRNA ligase [Candidatus Margulisiibacteriota bacterium]
MGEAKKFKDTLNLPWTDFPIRAGLAAREPELLQEMQAKDLYGRLLAQNRAGPRAILHDGPPYPNGDIHLGHALNKTLKDIVNKYLAMTGHYTPYVPGWDCHGLPIETQLLKDLSKTRTPVPGKTEFRAKCREYALGYVNKQRAQFQRLGVLADWEHPYLTLQPEYEAEVLRVFKELALGGYVYKGNKPVHWCLECQTALAEAEIEYAAHSSASIYMKFPLTGTQKTGKQLYAGPAAGGTAGLADLIPPGHTASLIVWTTTPWTLPANTAVAVNPELRYAVAAVKPDASPAPGVRKDELLVVGEPLAAQVFKELGLTCTIRGTLSGRELEGLICRHPFIDRPAPVVCAEYVTAGDGTGCVHIAPGHGQEDHAVGLKYDLPVLMPVDARGIFTAEAGQFAGLKVTAADQAVIAQLQAAGSLLKVKKLEHSYPHCWRCKKPVIFRATPQWFVSMDREGRHGGIRTQALAAIQHKVKWIPDWGQNRIYTMIENRPDWCISRQRSWGIPIPVFYCEECGEPQFEPQFFDAVIERTARDGLDSWFKLPAAEILPAGLSCKCGGQKFRKETDILDVWFESGASQAAVLRSRPELSWPADLYLEGSDQHRGWFHSSLLVSIGCTGEPPYRAVLTHGFTVDEKGRKLSKSLGNTVDILQTIGTYGADVLRFWTASVDFKNDLAASDSIFKQVQECYAKIRNTWRFLLSNLYDYKPAGPGVEAPLDKWIISRLQGLVAEANDAYQNYDYHKLCHRAHDFCANELSALYLDLQKDNLYCNAPDAPERRSCQAALKIILVTLVKLLTPVLSYTCEDIYKYIKQVAPDEKAEFVLLTAMPQADPALVDTELEARYERLLKIRTEVYKVLEARRAEKVLTSSTEAEIVLTAPAGLLAGITPRELETFLIVSSVKLQTGDLHVEVSKSAGVKCLRCWKFYPELNSDGLCPRCAAAVTQQSL